MALIKDRGDNLGVLALREVAAGLVDSDSVAKTDQETRLGDEIGFPRRRGFDPEAPVSSESMISDQWLNAMAEESKTFTEKTSKEEAAKLFEGTGSEQKPKSEKE